MSDVVIQARRLPGIGRRYCLSTDTDVQLMIVVEDGARGIW